MIIDPNDSSVQVLMQDSRVIAAAHATHEANRAYCKWQGDDSQPNWDWAPDWQRTSELLGVIGVLRGNTPEDSHASWLAEKERTGWVYGEKKDPDASPPTHPCMVPYADLPSSQRQKDVIFTGVATAMLYAVGMFTPGKVENKQVA